jgi:hypothetical protein
MKKRASHLKPTQLRGKALAVLVRELGYADAVRFMLLHKRGKGDYTKDREKLLPRMSMKELVRAADEIAKRAGPGKRRKSA